MFLGGSLMFVTYVLIADIVLQASGGALHGMGVGHGPPGQIKKINNYRSNLQDFKQFCDVFYFRNIQILVNSVVAHLEK